MKRILTLTTFVFTVSVLLTACEPMDAVDPFSIAHESGKKDVSDIGAAIGAKHLAWNTDSWHVSNETYDGNGSVESGNCGGGRATSTLSTTITGPCQLSFYFQRNFYNGHFTVMCDTTIVYSLSGYYHNNWSWNHCQVSIPHGSHALSFVYTHSGIGWWYEWSGVRIDAIHIEK